MKTWRVVTVVLVLGGLLHCQPASQEKEPADNPPIAIAAETSTAESSPGMQVAPSLQPYALSILKQMSDTLRSAEQFTFHAEGHDEEVIEDLGQKVHVGTSVDFVVRRPNRLWVNYRDDFTHKRFLYDGANIALLSVPEAFYATASAPPRIETTLDSIMDEYGITLPLADFVYPNPYEVLTAEVTGGFYAGLHEVRGVACHHLAFSQQEFDWQIWIEDGKHMVPRKFVISYKNEPHYPQYTAYFSDWDFSPQLPDALFVFLPPEKGQQIEFESH